MHYSLSKKTCCVGNSIPKKPLDTSLQWVGNNNLNSPKGKLAQIYINLYHDFIWYVGQKSYTKVSIFKFIYLSLPKSPLSGQMDSF